MMRFRYIIEVAALWLLLHAFRLLPLDLSSYIGGMMARGIGPFLKAHRIAVENLLRAMPDLSASQRHDILTRMWDNLGRSAAEFANLDNPALYKRVSLHGVEHITNNAPPIMFFSGHFANWELSYPSIFQQGVPIIITYRKANNPYVDRLVDNLRRTQASDSFPKGPHGAIRFGRAIKSKSNIAVLMDQKMNEGIAVPFFGRPAMTVPTIAELALRYGLQLIPIRVVRTRGCHFDWVAYPPLQYEKTGDHDKDVMGILTQINRMIESWVREHPEQWFWVHQRWTKEG